MVLVTDNADFQITEKLEENGERAKAETFISRKSSTRIAELVRLNLFNFLLFINIISIGI